MQYLEKFEELVPHVDNHYLIIAERIEFCNVERICHQNKGDCKGEKNIAVFLEKALLFLCDERRFVFLFAAEN